jgi:hypothetical protein
MPDTPAEDTPGREERQEEDSIDEEPFDEEEFDPEEAERHITRFITSADELPGPPVAQLVEDVARLMQTARAGLETLMNNIPHNKVLATQLLLGQRARGLQDSDSERWQLQAASTLLSELVVRGASR